jgi:hypothetical protein
MTRPDHDGTLYRAQPHESRLPGQPIAIDAATLEPDIAEPPARPDALAAPTASPPARTGPHTDTGAEAWSSRATTTRGMIGRPASRAAVESAAAGQVSGLATGLATTALPDVATRPVELVPDPPRNGTVYGQRQPDRAGKVLSGRMARLHIGWHSASVGALSIIGVSAAGAGLVLGADRQQRPVPIRFFRPEPTRITLIGGDWVASIVVFRALALGAYVTVWTDDPGAWRGLGERATGAGDRVVINAEHARPPAATAQTPHLIIDDGAIGFSNEAGPQPWRTQMTILARLDPHGVPAIQDSHLVLTQRLAPAEAALAATALRLGSAGAVPLQQLDDETIALVGATGHQYVRINPTDIERGFAGSARR